ncbi:MAG: helix-turn-helix transcriptional regulator [Clostridia bacterium]|nr:helix-turn-helix transcriptional regulator [Clostridia bacterium]
MIKIGEKIKTLRKKRGISQENLAEHIGVSFQAVSKWENGSSMPDVLLIPAIASFFGVSTDELFDFNLYETEKKVEKIVGEYSKCWGNGDICKDPARCEEIIREGLKKYPGNDILLNCLIGTIPLPERAAEVIEIGKQLVRSTGYDEIRIDAYRIMAEAYKSLGEYSMCREAIEKIPEVYFSSLYVKAELLEGDERFEAANKEKNLSAEHLVYMLEILSGHYAAWGEKSKARIQLEIAIKVMEAFENDFSTGYTKCAYDPEKIKVLTEKISAL